MLSFRLHFKGRTKIEKNIYIITVHLHITSKINIKCNFQNTNSTGRIQGRSYVHLKLT